MHIQCERSNPDSIPIKTGLKAQCERAIILDKCKALWASGSTMSVSVHVHA